MVRIKARSARLRPEDFLVLGVAARCSRGRGTRAQESYDSDYSYFRRDSRLCPDISIIPNGFALLYSSADIKQKGNIVFFLLN